MTEYLTVTPEAVDILRGQVPVVEDRRYNCGLVRLEVPNEVRQAVLWEMRPGESVSDAVMRVYR